MQLNIVTYAILYFIFEIMLSVFCKIWYIFIHIWRTYHWVICESYTLLSHLLPLAFCAYKAHLIYIYNYKKSHKFIRIMICEQSYNKFMHPTHLQTWTSIQLLHHQSNTNQWEIHSNPLQNQCPHSSVPWTPTPLKFSILTSQTGTPCGHLCTSTTRTKTSISITQ